MRNKSYYITSCATLTKMKEEILKSIINEPTKFGDFYINHFEKIHKYTRNKTGINTDTYISDFIKELDRIRFSTVFSDFTNIYPAGLGNGGNFVIKPEQNVTVNDSILKAVVSRNKQPILNAGFLLRDEKELSDFLKTIEPLIISERAMMHNSRIIIGLKEQRKKANQPNTWEVYDVQPNSSVGNWLSLENSEKQNSTPINFNPESLKNKKELFDITIPYLKGIPITELNKVLNDNEDLISSFRKNLKLVVDEAKKNSKTLIEMKNDIVRPEVDMISKKFKRVKEIHGLKIAGTVLSTVTLGMVGYSTMGIGSIVSGFLGAGGLGMLVKQEVDYKNEIAKLEDNPFYLMWKFKNEK